MSQTFAFYFPQFCSEPINDEAWYKGFTDWDLIKNVLIRHSEEHKKFLPKAGFYQQETEEVISSQIQEAQRIGISGFCSYHYWFDGKPALDTPVELLRIAANKLGFSYFLCWANESWTKRWAGRDEETIISQTYTDDETLVRNHVSFLRKHFSTPSYYRIQDRPVFLIYNPNSVGFLEILPMYKIIFSKEGLNPFLVAVETDFLHAPAPTGKFDMTLRFEPRAYFSYNRQRSGKKLYWGVKRASEAFPRLSRFLISRFVDKYKSYSYSHYSDYLSHSLANLKSRTTAGERTSTSVIFHWDNTPRYLGLATRFTGVTETLAHQNLCKVLDWAQEQSVPFVIINAWNEWTEGATLEQRVFQDFDSADVVKKAIERMALQA